MYKSTIVVAFVVCGALLVVSDEAANTGGALHKTLSKLNSVADSVPKVVHSINDGIEVRVENIVHPAEDGFMRRTMKKAAKLAGAVGREVGGFASKVGSAAAEMGRHTADAIRSSVRNSMSRISGAEPTKAPATVESSVTNLVVEPAVEVTNGPDELVKQTITEETTAAAATTSTDAPTTAAA